jgi:hypothetical protein
MALDILVLKFLNCQLIQFILFPIDKFPFNFILIPDESVFMMPVEVVRFQIIIIGIIDLSQ